MKTKAQSAKRATTKKPTKKLTKKASTRKASTQKTSRKTSRKHEEEELEIEEFQQAGIWDLVFANVKDLFIQLPNGELSPLRPHQKTAVKRFAKEGVDAEEEIVSKGKKVWYVTSDGTKLKIMISKANAHKTEPKPMFIDRSGFFERMSSI